MGRKNGSVQKSKEIKGVIDEKGTYKYDTICEICNKKTTNLGMHCKSKSHRIKQLIASDISAEDKYIQFAIINNKRF